MCGIVTLAAALALPTGEDGTAAFPHRDLILFCSFAVVLGTLVLQGMTLRPLIRMFKLEDDGSVEREIQLARVETLRAAITAIADQQLDELSQLLHRRYQLMLERAHAELHGEAPPIEAADTRALAGATAVQLAITAERRQLLALRTDGTIGDTAFQRIEQELDLKELDLGG
jgi:monovalent cation/hydrogen antiporter